MKNVGAVCWLKYGLLPSAKIFQPIVSCYTDYTLLAPCNILDHVTSQQTRNMDYFQMLKSSDP